MSEPLLAVEGLRVEYHVGAGKLPALHDFNLAIASGEIVGVVGESGCGKSTLAAALLQLLPANGQITAGRLRLRGRDLRSLSSEEMRRVRGAEVAMIFQDPLTSLNPTFTVGKQIVNAVRAHESRREVSAGELRSRAVAMLDRVGIPDACDRVDRYPHEFSGGMRQRAMIATALMLKPALLIADEATSSLDVTLEAQILELLKQLREDHGTAILFVSHDLGVVSQVCDRVIVMYAGRAVEEADTATIFEAPKHPYTRALLAAVPQRSRRSNRLATIPGRVPSLATLSSGCKFAERCPEARIVCTVDEPSSLDAGSGWVRCFIHDPRSGYDTSAPAGLPESAQQPETRRDSGHACSPRLADRQHDRSTLITVQGLRTYFETRRTIVERMIGISRPSVRAVDGVDVEIRRGEILGLVGESGSGKTTLGRSILRLIPPTEGKVIYDGIDVRSLRGRELRRLRRRMQMIFQDPYSSLSPRLRVSALLTEPYAINDVPVEDRYPVSELLEMVELTPEQASKYPHELSGGQARRVGIARALALKPEFLVADEPTSGLDVSAAASVLNLMKNLAGDLGLTYLIITHNLNVVGFIADRIAVMYLGQVVEVGPTDQIFDSPAHPYTQGLLDAVSTPSPRRRKARHRLLLPGEIPSQTNPPHGCRFHPRCVFAEDRCRSDEPRLENVASAQLAACYFWRTVKRQASPLHAEVTEFGTPDAAP